MSVAVDIDQLNPSLCGEFGVQADHLDCERYLVDDALACRLSSRPKFQILGAIIRSLTIPMMDVFPGKKRSSKDSSHNNSMLVNGFAFPGDGNWPDDPSVSVLAKMSAGFSIKKSFGGSLPNRCIGACPGAEPLFSDVCAASEFAGVFVMVFVPPHRSYGTAFFTNEGCCGSVFSRRVFPPTLYRAVQGIAAKAVSHLFHSSKRFAERIAAIATRKLDGLRRHNSTSDEWSVQCGIAYLKAQHLSCGQVLAMEF